MLQFYVYRYVRANVTQKLMVSHISPVFCNNGDIRLMGGTTRYEGRVELCWNEMWGTICDGFWSTNDANVACKQLGFLDTGNPCAQNTTC